MDTATESILIETASTLITIEMQQKCIEEEVEREKEPEPEPEQEQEQEQKQPQRRDSTKYENELEKNADDEKECSSILSAISNEEVSITSEILDQKSFVPRKDSDGEDLNGHICHIDSPETDTYPNSDIIHGESLMDDISSMLGEVYGYGQDSVDNTYTDDTTLFPSDIGKDDKHLYRSPITPCPK